MSKFLCLRFRQLLRAYCNPWVLSCLLITVTVALPIFVIFSHLSWDGSGGKESLSELGIQEWEFEDALDNTGILMLGTGLITLILGSSTAWLVTFYRFPGSKLFSWGLVLPLAIPPYIASDTYWNIFDYTGYIPYTLAKQGINPLYFIENFAHDMEGAIFIFSFVLYPYVYLLARASFLQQSGSLLESSRLLGRGSWGTFFRLGFPLARPAIIGGVALVLMEVLNDYGAVERYGIKTLTTMIFKVWTEYESYSGALHLAAILLLLVFFILALESIQRWGINYTVLTQGKQGEKPQLKKGKAFAAFCCCAIPFGFGFLIPTGQLLYWASQTFSQVWDRDLAWSIINSLSLAFVASTLTMILALVMLYSLRLHKTTLLSFATKVATLGYATPGAVVAAVVILSLTWLDQTLLYSLFFLPLILGYVIRFLRLSFYSIESSGFDQISPSLDEASKSLGATPGRTLLRIHLPLLRPALIIAFIFVFVEVLKELTLTMILAPPSSDFFTLSTITFRLAVTDGVPYRAATPSLIIILAGIIPVFILNYLLYRDSKND